MTWMRERAEDYLAMRRALGHRLGCQGRLLLDFAGQMDRAGQARLTVRDAVEWACSTSAGPVTRRQRLSVIRCFARHLAALDPSCEVPPPGLLKATARRPAPRHLRTVAAATRRSAAIRSLARPRAAASATCARSRSRYGVFAPRTRFFRILRSDAVSVTGTAADGMPSPRGNYSHVIHSGHKIITRAGTPGRHDGARARHPGTCEARKYDWGGDLRFSVATPGGKAAM